MLKTRKNAATAGGSCLLMTGTPSAPSAELVRGKMVARLKRIGVRRIGNPLMQKKHSLKASREKARANLKNQSVSGGEPSPRGGIRETISLQAAGSPRRHSAGVLTESSVPTLCPSFQSALNKGDTGNPTSKVPPKKVKKSKSTPGVQKTTKKLKTGAEPSLGQGTSPAPQSLREQGISQVPPATGWSSSTVVGFNGMNPTRLHSKSSAPATVSRAPDDPPGSSPAGILVPPMEQGEDLVQVDPTGPDQAQLANDLPHTGVESQATSSPDPENQVDGATGEQPATTSAPLKDDSLSSLIRMLAEPGVIGQMTQLLQSASKHQPPSTFEGGSSTTGAPTAPSEDDESEDDEDSQFGDAPESPHLEGEFPSSPPPRWSYPHPVDIPQREHPEVGGYPDASLYTSASDQSGVAPGWPQPTPVDPLREPARPPGPEEGTQGERTVPTIPPLTCWKGPDGQTMYLPSSFGPSQTDPASKLKQRKGGRTLKETPWATSAQDFTLQQDPSQAPCKGGMLGSLSLGYL